MQWKNGHAQVMVATTAFGMGIYGVPENLCSWAQELGRAGQDNQQQCSFISLTLSMQEHG